MVRLVLLGSAVAACAAYTPAFFWSEKFDAGLGRNAQHLKEVSGAVIEHTVASMSNGSPTDSTVESLLQRAPSSEQPEMQVVFLTDLDTDVVREHPLTNVQRLMGTSASSLTVPFTSRVETDSPIMFRTATRVPGDEAEAYLAANPELFTNKVTDLLVIELPKHDGAPAEALQVQDAFVGRFCGAVSKATGGNYAALLTGKGKHPIVARRQLGDSSGPVPLRITRDLLTALLVGLILIIVFMSGFCCLFSLQTPRKFEDVLKQNANN